uniref:Secreted protein n=1 Tax=Bactrocera latifrons TaxID=174628 RepID=A0A0K8VZG6_BACLA
MLCVSAVKIFLPLCFLFFLEKANPARDFASPPKWLTTPQSTRTPAKCMQIAQYIHILTSYMYICIYIHSYVDIHIHIRCMYVPVHAEILKINFHFVVIFFPTATNLCQIKILHCTRIIVILQIRKMANTAHISLLVGVIDVTFCIVLKPQIVCRL